MVGPDFVRPDAKVQSQWTPADGKSAITPQAASADTFWAGFGDQLLPKLLQLAVERSPTLASTAETVIQAQQILRSDQGNSLPVISLNPSSNYSQPDIASRLKGKQGDSVTTQVLGQLSWEVDLWGKWRRLLEADRANVLMSQAMLAAARVSLEASVASAYCNIRVFERRIAVANANLVQQAENMRIAGVRYRLGATSELDLRQAQTQYEQTKSQIPGLRNSLAQYQHALSVLLGETPDYFARTFAAGTALPDAPGVLPLGAPRDLLRRRPDVLQAEFAAAAQSAHIGQSEAALYPSFTLSGAIGYSRVTGGGPLFSWDNRSLSYGAGINLPIFDRGRLLAQVKVQDSLFKQSVLAYQNQVLKAQQDVEDALAAIETGNSQLAALQRADSAAARTSALALLQYRSGQTDYTTVSSAEQAHLQTSDTVVQVQGGVLQAYISAYRALGGGWDPVVPASVGGNTQ